MMEIVVLSDTHGDLGCFERLWLRFRAADMFIHLGDGAAETAAMRDRHPESVFAAVCGNCDFNCAEPAETLLTLSGRRVFLTHGHRYGVKRSIRSLMGAGGEHRAEAVLFGHTHLPFCERVDGVLALNPGSLSHPRRGAPSFGLLLVTKDDISASVRYL